MAEAELERDVRVHHPPHPLLERSATGGARGSGLGNPDAVGMVPRHGGFLSHTERRPRACRRG